MHICVEKSLWDEVWYDGIVVNLDIPYFKINIFWDSRCSSAVGTGFVFLCTEVFSCVSTQDKIPVRLNVVALGTNEASPSHYSC